jgi:arylsulfatase A-like enzyme
MSDSTDSPFSDAPKQQKGRRDALKKLGSLGLTSVLGGLAPASEGQSAPAAHTGDGGDADRPNVIFIFTDDHTVGALSCYGSTRIDTPNLDRLAGEGMLFNDCCVTNSLCAPSRAAVLTGKYSHKHGVTENLYGDQEPFDGSQQTFPKLLQDAGYQTAMIGKWHLKSEPTGFDYWKVLPGQGRYNNPRFIEMDGERTKEEGYVTDVITDLTIDKLDEYRDQDEPFALMSWHKAPHRGWVPEEDDEDLYTGFDMPVPPTFNDDHANRSSAASHAYMDIATMPDWREEQPDDLSEQEIKYWNYQRYIKNYLRVVKSLDENVGRLLDYLEETGMAENTMIVYSSDNGMFLGEHGWFDKRFMYEESLRIPLLVRYPGVVPAGEETDRVVMNLDFAQTFLDYADADIPSDMQGRSLRPLLENRNVDDWRDTVYYHYYEYPGPHKVRPHYGVRSERYKLMYFYTIDEWELFDLEMDPHELNNLYDAPAYQDVVREMKTELREQRRRYEDDTGAPVPE